MPTLIVMCGPPGAGKSTWVEQHKCDAIVMSADVVRRNPRQRMMNQLAGMKIIAPDHLRRGHDVIIDACSVGSTDRKDWLQVARIARASTRLVIIDADVETCVSRQSERGRAAVPESIVRLRCEQMGHARALIALEQWDEIIEPLLCQPTK